MIMPILFLTDDDKCTIIQNKVSTLAYPTITIPKHEPSSVIPSSSFVRVVGQTSTKSVDKANQLESLSDYVIVAYLGR
jgi:hypothetical protein